ncbi:MAG: hypothetical protein NVS4B3_10380 [Gemmatimonadaceae bacterium]
MSNALAHLISTYGYAVVAFFVFVESIGVPVPGETALVTAAAFAATGKLSIIGVIASATLAAIAGGPAGYWVGMAGGLALLRRHGRVLRVTEARLEQARTYFDRHGAKTVFIARFVALLRFVAALLAGVTRMPFWRFFFANAAGGLVWAATYGGVGFAFGSNLPLLERYLGRASTAVAALVVVVAGGVIVWRWRAAQEAAQQAAPPGEGRIEIRAREPGWARARALALTLAVGAVAALAELRRRPWLWELVVRCGIGLALSVASLAAFGLITGDVVTGDPLTVFDITVARHIQAVAHPAGVSVARTVSFFGSRLPMAALLVAGTAILWRRRHRLLATAWIAAFAGGGVLDAALKSLIRRPRPVTDDPFPAELGGSFPSGHVIGALIGYGMLAYVITRFPFGRRHGRTIDAGAVALILAIGASRLYVGVHYFTDVVGGFTAGTVWLAAMISAVEAVRNRTDARTMEVRP